jgi:hypothetical protein
MQPQVAVKLSVLQGKRCTAVAAAAHLACHQGGSKLERRIVQGWQQLSHAPQAHALLCEV